MWVFDFLVEDAAVSFRVRYTVHMRRVWTLKNQIEGEQTDAQALIIDWASGELERQLASGELPGENESGLIEVSVEDDAIERAARLHSRKRCEYQAWRGRDLWCTAGLVVTPAGSVPKDFPISPRDCRECSVPRSESICSRLMHLRVTLAFGSPAMGPGSAACADDSAALDVARVDRCAPGRNKCWVREVEVESAGRVEVVPPLVLLQALDYLSLAWKVASGTGEKLVTPGDLEVAGTLTLPCTNRDEFSGHAVALKHLIDTFKVGVRPDGATNEEWNGTLNQLETVLIARARSMLPPDDVEPAVARIKKAIRPFRAAARLRNAVGHPNNENLAKAMRDLDVPFPVLDWGRAWDVVRYRVVEAAHALRIEVEALGG